MEDNSTILNIEDYTTMKAFLPNKESEESKRIEMHKLKGFEIISIGVMESIFNKKNGTPRQSGICPQSKGIIRLHKTLFNNPEHTFEGIEQFQFVWILYYFHENRSKRRLNAKVHPPRLNGKSCGVFASRAPHRPNPIGLSLARIEACKDGCLHVSGIDVIDGTPVIDIKPYIQQYDQPNLDESLSTIIPRIEQSEEPETPSTSTSIPEGWVDGSIVTNVFVEFTSRSSSQLCQFHAPTPSHTDCLYCFRLFKNIDEAREAIVNLLHADPRSVYRRNKCVDRLYYFTIDAIHITAWFDIETNLVEVVKVKPLPLAARKFA